MVWIQAGGGRRVGGGGGGVLAGGSSRRGDRRDDRRAQFVTMARTCARSRAVYIRTGCSGSSARTRRRPVAARGVLATLLRVRANASINHAGAVDGGDRRDDRAQTWIGFGSATAWLREMQGRGRLLSSTVLITVWAPNQVRLLRGLSSDANKSNSRLSGKTWEGFVIGRRRDIRVVLALLREPATVGRAGRAVRSARRRASRSGPASYSRSMIKRDMEVKDTGRLLGGARRRHRTG